MTEDLVARRANEGLEVYITRLQSIDRTGLSEDEQTALALSLRVAQRRLQRAYLNAEIPGLSALERCKQAIRRLSRGERNQLTRWLAEGMPG